MEVFAMFKWIFLISFLVTNPLWAAESSVSMTSEKVESILSDQLTNKKFQDNLDITDARLKADSGSLSRYSLKFNMTYAGPTVTDLSEKDQPNPDGTIGSFQTALSGTMGARYRINSRSTIGISTGLKAIHPFHGMERIDLSNPILNYDYSTRVADIQMKNSPGFVLRDGSNRP